MSAAESDSRETSIPFISVMSADQEDLSRGERENNKGRALQSPAMHSPSAFRWMVLIM